jgi:hypothetical protein
MTKNTVTKNDITALQQQLWQSNSRGQVPMVYAILDGARDQEIERIVRQGTLKSACLYEGKLTFKMAQAAPYLIRLEKDHPQTIDILKKGWGNNWGIFAITYQGATHINIRHNCRKIARVKGPNGKNLVFRYYDPRVLRTYITQCDINEAEKVFGPISEFIVEGEQHNTMHRFKRVKSAVIDCHNANDINITLCDEHEDFIRGDSGALSITSEQFSVFEQEKFKRFIAQMEVHLTTHFEAQTDKLIEQEQLNDWVTQNILNAQDFGFITELDICRYLNVAIVQGESVKDAPWLKAIMAESLFPSTKATLLEEKSLELLDQEHQEVKEALEQVNLQILEEFYQKHHKKVLGIGVPLYDMNFENESALKEWMFRIGLQCIHLGLTDEMALDLWLDIAMRYGEDFLQEDWAVLSKAQKEALSPSDILFHLLAQQPHKKSA